VERANYDPTEWSALSQSRKVIKGDFVGEMKRYAKFNANPFMLKKFFWKWLKYNDKKLSYRRVTARCVLSVVILPIATQQCRNYLYDKS